MSPLSPFSIIYGALINARNWCYDRGILQIHKVGLPVVCIGNVTAGGNGKTPLTIWLCEKLRGSQRAPVVLSRGYRGRLAGPHLVSKIDSSELVGDEPLMMVRNHQLKVVVAKDRVQGAHFIVEQKLGDIIVLDDGLQHRRLGRDKNILCIDVSCERSVDELLSGKLLPQGRLREPIYNVLARSDVVILNHRGPKRPELAKKVRDTIKFSGTVLESYIGDGKFLGLNGEQVLAPKEAIIVCALGHPEGFVASVEESGCRPVAKHLFTDHEKISAKELMKIRTRNPGLPIVISSKDRVRLSDAEWGPGVLEFRGELIVEGNVDWSTGVSL